MPIQIMLLDFRRAHLVRFMLQVRVRRNKNLAIVTQSLTLVGRAGRIHLRPWKGKGLARARALENKSLGKQGDAGRTGSAP